VATTITLTHGRKSAIPSRKTRKPKGAPWTGRHEKAGAAGRHPAPPDDYAERLARPLTAGPTGRGRERAEHALLLAGQLAELYPEACITLDFATPWQCLAAVILSAQCTDERVNRITPRLFAAFPNPASTAGARPDAIEDIIRSAGFFREKARALIAAATAIVERFDGQVPSAMEELLTLTGVGRKTANVVLGHVFGRPAIAVDTHVRRVAYRLGLTRHREPDKIERDLARLLPPSHWTQFSMRLILHGRRVCRARDPQCARCRLLEMCPRRGLRSPPHRRRIRST
jgi:endonuclease-3